MADGTLFERRGIPAASICTDSFKSSGDAMANVQGYPGYRYIMMPHPLARLTPEQVKERANQMLPEVLEILGIEEARA